MPNQTALVLTAIGKPLETLTVPIPDVSKLKEYEILIKITAAGICPHDQKIRDENLLNVGSRLPFILAADLAGTVVHNGPNAFSLIGSHVFSQGLLHRPMNGGLQEYAIIDSRYAATVPAGISDITAALYPINAVTAAMSLFSAIGFGWPFPGTSEAAGFDYATKKVAIVGAGTNVGRLAIQFAKLAGVGIIIAIASASGAEHLKHLGATHVVDRKASDVEVQVHDIVLDDLIYVYDTFTKGDQSLGVSLLSNSKKGIFVHITEGKASEAVLASKSGGVDVKFVQGISSAIPDFGQLFWKQLPTWLETGKVKPLEFKVIEGLDAAKVNRVLDEYREGRGERYHVQLL